MNTDKHRFLYKEETHRIIVDTKVIENIGDNEMGQMINYLKITGLKVGLFLNFKHSKLEWERIVL